MDHVVFIMIDANVYIEVNTFSCVNGDSAADLGTN